MLMEGTKFKGNSLIIFMLEVRQIMRGFLYKISWDFIVNPPSLARAVFNQFGGIWGKVTMAKKIEFFLFASGKL